VKRYCKGALCWGSQTVSVGSHRRDCVELSKLLRQHGATEESKMPALSEMKAPAGVSKDALFQKNVSYARKDDKRKEEEGRMASKMMTGGTAVVSSIAAGFVFTKFPNMAHFDKAKRISVPAVLAAGALVGALVTDDETSDVLEGAAYGLGIPFLANWGGELAAKMTAK
jgi:hypothetical protein